MNANPWKSAGLFESPLLADVTAVKLRESYPELEVRSRKVTTNRRVWWRVQYRTKVTKSDER